MFPFLLHLTITSSCDFDVSPGGLLTLLHEAVQNVNGLLEFRDMEVPRLKSSLDKLQLIAHLVAGILGILRSRSRLSPNQRTGLKLDFNDLIIYESICSPIVKN